MSLLTAAVCAGVMTAAGPAPSALPRSAPETMTVGHHDEDLVKKFLSIPVAHKPGTFFVYNTPASYMLSAIVQKVTGQTVLDYLRPRLFDPLGIENPTWQASKQGISMGGFGLNLKTEDIARFGVPYLHKDEWQGRQLVPASWVEAATSRQVSNGSSPSSDWEQGYGHQFWRARHGFYRGDGAHGSGAWKKGTVSAAGDEEPIAVAGGWSGPDTYTLVITRYRTPFSTKLELRFGGNLLAVRSENNIGSPEGRIAEFIGEAAAKGTTNALR